MIYAELAKFASSKIFIIGVVQILGALALDVKNYKIDVLVVDGHQWLQGPQGVAIFYCNQEKIDGQLHNIDVVWANVISEYDFLNLDLTQKPEAVRFEEGSYNTVGICDLKSVLDLILASGITKIESRTLNLIDHLIDRLKAKKTHNHQPLRKPIRAIRSLIQIIRVLRLN